MEKRKHIVIILFIGFCSLFCSCHKHTTQPPVEVVPPKGSIPVTVIDYSELDGCTYLLEKEDGTKLQPVNLDDKYKVNGMKLYITFKYNDGMSVCMAGRMIDITSVVKSISK